jgi:hypothetical protein
VLALTAYRASTNKRSAILFGNSNCSRLWNVLLMMTVNTKYNTRRHDLIAYNH